MKQFGLKEKTKQRKTKITELGFDENDRSLAAIALATQSYHCLSLYRDFQPIQQARALSVESWL